MQPPLAAYKCDVSWSVPQMTRLLGSLVHVRVRVLDATPAIASVLSLICGTKFFFSIRDHSYFFTLFKLNCTRLSECQAERHAKCWWGRKKEKEAAAPAILHIFPVDSAIHRKVSSRNLSRLMKLKQIKTQLSS